jgi:hypothetical protein
VFTQYNFRHIYREGFSTLLQNKADLLFVLQQMAAAFIKIDLRARKTFCPKP